MLDFLDFNRKQTYDYPAMLRNLAEQIEQGNVSVFSTELDLSPLDPAYASIKFNFRGTPLKL